jgi:hypothetical protein
VAVSSCVTLLLALLAKRWPTSNLKYLWRIGLLLVAMLVALVGHQGGELTYGEKHFESAFQYLHE